MTHAERLRQHAAELLALADQIDKQAAFPRLLNAASARRLCVKRAADAFGLSARTVYRLAPQIGERDGRAWVIDADRLAALLQRRGEALPGVAKFGEQACFGASANQRPSHRKDRP
jgi:hypothetical protein